MRPQHPLRPRLGVICHARTDNQAPDQQTSSLLVFSVPSSAPGTLRTRPTQSNSSDQYFHQSIGPNRQQHAILTPGPGRGAKIGSRTCRPSKQRPTETEHRFLSRSIRPRSRPTPVELSIARLPSPAIITTTRAAERETMHECMPTDIAEMMEFVISLAQFSLQQKKRHPGSPAPRGVPWRIHRVMQPLLTQPSRPGLAAPCLDISRPGLSRCL